MKRILSVLLACVLLACALTGCQGLFEEKMTTYKGGGISVELPEGMTEEDIVTATYCLQSAYHLFTVTQEAKKDLGDQVHNMDEYLKLVMKVNKIEGETKEKDGVKYFTYKATNDKEYFYLATAVENEEYFFLCNFACASSKQDEYEPKFLEWAKTIKAE